MYLKNRKVRNAFKILYIIYHKSSSLQKVVSLNLKMWRKEYFKFQILVH